MITRADIVERVTEWGLTEEVVEKDYVLGWLLWGIGADPVLSDAWVFKGGTCLKKCYVETYRFSEDLDFTVLPGGPFRPDDVEPLLARTLARVADESGLDFSTPPRLRLRPNETSSEGRVYYTGPRRTPQPARASRAARAAPEYVYECNRCGRTFAHTTRNSKLRPHNDSEGYRCSGRSGHFVGTE